MIPEPQRPNRSTRWGSWANQLHDWIRSHIVRSSPTVKATYTPNGIFLEAVGGGRNGSVAKLQFKGQWDIANSYSKDDIVIRKTDSEKDDGNKAGTYIATAAVAAYEMPPGEGSGGTGASFGVTISGGAVTGITVLNGGSGYPNYGLQISITGDGTGATASPVLTNGVITSVTIDTGGSGYTSAAASAVNPPQHWADFALGRWQKLTFRVGLQRIIIDAGRDGGDDAGLVIYHDYTDETAGSVQINLADMPVGAGDKVIKIREMTFCSGGTPVKALFLVSDTYV